MLAKKSPGHRPWNADANYRHYKSITTAYFYFVIGWPILLHHAYLDHDFMAGIGVLTCKTPIPFFVSLFDLFLIPYYVEKANNKTINPTIGDY